MPVPTPKQQSDINKRMRDMLDNLTMTGFAPYTPVTVSSHTFPYQAADKDGGSIKPGHVQYFPAPTASVVFKCIDQDDGFNPYGSGPEPIGPRQDA